MKLKFTYKNVKENHFSESFVKKKLEKMSKWAPENLHFDWLISLSKNNKYSAEATVHSRHFDMNVSCKDENLRTCLEMAMSKIEKKLLKQKDIWKKKQTKMTVSSKNIKKLDPDLAWIEHDDEYFDDVG